MVALLDPRLWLAAILAVLLAYGGGRLQQRSHDAAAYQAERTKAALAAAQDQIQAVNKARAEEQRRTNEQAGIAQDATKQAESARADSRAAGAVADRLQLRINQLLAAARAAKDPSPAGAGAPATDSGELLAQLFRRADERAGILAADLDAARIAGFACQRAYDALTPPEGNSAR